MSDKYETLKSKWEKGYISRDTLAGWVALNEKKPGKGITPEEFEAITGEKYDEKPSDHRGAVRHCGASE